ncbi:IS1595 family transposase [Glutamicibacter sp. AOP3-A1-12]|uniref:IS1595 family transposase n=1 Tax=Glutamicibacter sp. AOP3-A1-12 TaxID=3457701 RepID=UPI00403490F0
MRTSPTAGKDYPTSLAQFRSWFPTDADCSDYLDWLRWPDGFLCPSCFSIGDWADLAGIHRCSGCGRRFSATSGTIFHRTRTPLTIWFEAAWLMTVSKQGISALSLQRTTGLGSYQSAWTMLQKFRTVMSNSHHELLSGNVEMDETYLGGKGKPEVTGRGAAGKLVVAGAIERSGRSFGRARLQILPDAKSPSLERFIHQQIQPGSTLVTDGWRGYLKATKNAGVQHEIHNVSVSGLPAHVSLPGVHRLFSLVRRVLDGTYQGSVQSEQLQGYLDEFIYRFNRRHAQSRELVFFRLLEASVEAGPSSYQDIARVHRRTGTISRVGPTTEYYAPRSLANLSIARPWRSS